MWRCPQNPCPISSLTLPSEGISLRSSPGLRLYYPCRSERAGPRIAAILSVVESCRRLKIPIRNHLTDILPVERLTCERGLKYRCYEGRRAFRSCFHWSGSQLGSSLLRTCDIFVCAGTSSRAPS